MNQTAEFRIQTSPLHIPLWARLAGYLIVQATVVAIAGQYVLLKTRGDMLSEGRLQAIGGGLLMLGGLAFGIGAPAYQSWSRADDGAGRTDALPRQWGIVMIWAGIVAIAAIILFDSGGENQIVVAAWLASIFMATAAQLRGIHPRWPHITLADWGSLGALLLLLLVAFVTRNYHLTSLPYNLDGDFADVGNQARALATGQPNQIFTYGWATIPTLGYLPPWITMLFFGTGLAGLNAFGVAEGLLIIVGVFLLGRQLFSPRTGLLAAAILTISYTHLAASRQSSYIDPAFFMLFAVYFLLIGLEKDQGWALALSGIMSALCVEMYYSGRLIIPFVGLAFLHSLIFRRAWLLARWKPLLMWFATILITLGPMLLVFARDPGSLAAHTKEVPILDPSVMRHLQGVYGVTTVGDMLWQQLRHTALMFHYYPDKGTQFGLTMPYLDPFSGIFFALGLGYLLLNWRRLAAWSVGLWILLGVVLGCFLTVNPPFWPRLIILLPPVALACGVALDLLYGFILKGFKPFGRSATFSLLLATVLIFVGMGIRNWNAYADVKGTSAFPRTRIAHYMPAQPAPARAYLVSNDFTVRDREFEFLSPGRLVAKLTPAQARPPSRQSDHRRY